MRKCLVLLLLAMSAAFNAAADGSLSNRRAPAFSLPDINRAQHSLHDFWGKVVIVNFMMTSCPHCGDFSKLLARAKEKYGDRLEVVSIVDGQRENREAVRKYLETNNLNQLIVADPYGSVFASYLKLTPQNPSYTTPHYFVIDKNGWIQEDYGYSIANQGMFEADTLFSILDKYIQ